MLYSSKFRYYATLYTPLDASQLDAGTHEFLCLTPAERLRPSMTPSYLAGILAGFPLTLSRRRRAASAVAYGQYRQYIIAAQLPSRQQAARKKQCHLHMTAL